MNKFYLRLQYNNGLHQLVRVDNILEFSQIVKSEDCNKYFSLLLSKRLLMGDSGNKSFEINEPYTITLENSEFEKMQNKVNRKFNTVNKPNFKEFNLVMNSNTWPIIKIKRI